LLGLLDNVKIEKEMFSHLEKFKDVSEDDKVILCLSEGLWYSTSKMKEDNEYVSIDEGVILKLSDSSSLFNSDYEWIICSMMQS